MKQISILFLVLISGCASTPLPVAEFSSEDAYNAAASRRLPFGDLNSYEKVRVAFVAYHNLYDDTAKSKRLSAQRSNETGFYSSIIGVLGGIGKSVETAAVGAIGAAGAGLYGERYRLTVQASNYELAADAMLCMYNLLPNATDEGLRAYRFISPDSPADLEIRNIALEGLLSVRSKLGRLQAAFELGRPDPNKLKDAITEKKQDASDVPTQRSLLRARNVEPPSKEEVENYKKGIKVCAANITG